MTQRLPTPGGDNNDWGSILNGFLTVSHNADGSITKNAVQNAGGVTSVNGVSPVTGNVTLFASNFGAYVKPVGGIPSSDLDPSIQTELGLGASAVQLGGDLGGSAASPLVLKLNGVSLPASPPGVGQVLTATGTSATAWSPAASAAYTVVYPTNDQTGARDTTNVQNAINNGGLVWLAAGSFYVTGVTIDPATHNTSIWGMGPATRVYVVGGGTGISMHRSVNYGAQYGLPAQITVGSLRDFVVDGTNATAGAIGVDVGDGWGYDINLTIVNFAASGCIGLNIINRLFWTEKGRFTANLMNNDTALVIDSITVNHDISHEYCEYLIYIFCNGGQQGIVMQNGVNCAGCFFRVRGNMGSTDTNPAPRVPAMLTITGDDGAGDVSSLYASMLDIKVESNGTKTYTGTGIVFGSSENYIKHCQGHISHSLQNSRLNGGEFTFRGLIAGDSALSGVTTPTLPGSSVVQKNLGPDAMVYITGGTVTNIAISGNSTGVASGGFFLPAGGYITVAYSTAPTWTWVPASQTQY